MKSSIGHVLLAIFLLIFGIAGLAPVLHINLGQTAMVLPYLALGAGVMLLLGK
jgi:hypothetical protein